MDRAGLERLDSFPYRHRIADVMSAPPVTAPPSTSMAAAARIMRERGVSSVIASNGDGRVAGILTEKDLIDAVAEAGSAVLEAPIARFMSSPVATVPADRHVYVALGRMQRLGVRHLAVVDSAGRLAGIVTARALLRQRAASALKLGDAVETAETPQALAEIHRELPELARALLDEGAGAVVAASIISGVIRDIAGRAAALAERDLAEAGEGTAPAAYAYLVLGSAGRGESLLAADQDNAIVHAGTDADDPWFAELGRRASDILDGAGIPYCKGGVMASKPGWRASLEEWRRRIRGWVERPKGQSLLSVDIFYDFQPAAGDGALAETLRAAALAAAREPGFLPALAIAHEDFGSVLGIFGGFRTEQGRLDLKRHGLLPITSGARVLALRHGIAETGTPMRLRAVAERGGMAAGDAERLIEAQALLLELVLDQQIVDLAAGRPASAKVEVKRLSRAKRATLKEALTAVNLVDLTVQDALRIA